MSIYFDLTTTFFPLGIESLGDNWLQDAVFRKKGYPYYHLLITTKGTGMIEIAGKTLELKTGCGIFIAPFIPHHYFPKENTFWETSFLTLKGPFASHLDEIFFNEPYFYLEDTLFYQEKIPTLRKIYEEKSKDETFFSKEAYNLLLHLYQQVHTRLLTPEVVKRYLQPAISYMETHYSKDLFVTEIAKSLYITPQYLSRLFQQYYHCSTSQYLRDLRIKKAKELLLAKKKTDIQWISQQVGFKTSSHFIVNFKKATGYTPMAFRKLYDFSKD